MQSDRPGRRRVHRPAKVGNLQLAVKAEQQVFRLYVAVNHFFRVAVHQRVRQLEYILKRTPTWQVLWLIAWNKIVTSAASKHFRKHEAYDKHKKKKTCHWSRLCAKWCWTIHCCCKQLGVEFEVCGPSAYYIMKKMPILQHLPSPYNFMYSFTNPPSPLELYDTGHILYPPATWKPTGYIKNLYNNATSNSMM